jgi:hypothetical protein
LPTNTPAPTSTPEPSIFGVELAQLNAAGGLDLASGMGARWVRRNALLWASVENVEGARNWGAVAGLEQELQNASAKGMNVILIVRSAPTWAQQNLGHQCGPIRQDKFTAFAAFMRDAVARYSAAPFNVKYWEIWNEPDGDPSLFVNDPDTVFGCLGDKNDPYYGGGVYGNLLKAIYPQVKSANPNAQVLFGGLLLDCNPNTPPAGKNCLPSKFLEGALRAGAGSFFDGVSFHGYDYYQDFENYSNDNWQAAWNTTGPVGVVKARFIKNLLSQYGATGKFLINTEGALLVSGASNTTPTNDTFEYTKAVYAIKMYTTALAEGFRANIWYSLTGWSLSGLVDKNMNPYQAYKSAQFLASKVQNATFVAERTQYTGLHVYEFLSGGKRIWVAWSYDKTQRALTFPVTPRAIYDYSAVSVPVGGSLAIKEVPFIIELD